MQRHRELSLRAVIGQAPPARTAPGSGDRRSDWKDAAQVKPHGLAATGRTAWPRRDNLPETA